MALCKDIFDKGYEVYYDNYFSSVHLAVDLLERGTTSVATTRPNRVGFPKDDINKESVAGCSRGMSNSTVLNDKVHCFVWLDNKPVFLNQVRAGLWPAHAWFLKIDLVQIVVMCACVCVSAPEAINN